MQRFRGVFRAPFLCIPQPALSDFVQVPKTCHFGTFASNTCSRQYFGQKHRDEIDFRFFGLRSLSQYRHDDSFLAV